MDEPAQKKRKSMKNTAEDIHYYGAELVVYDKHQRCLLTDGEYQLVLQDLGQRNSPKKLSSWETFPEGKEKVSNTNMTLPQYEVNFNLNRLYVESNAILFSTFGCLYPSHQLIKL